MVAGEPTDGQELRLEPALAAGRERDHERQPVSVPTKVFKYAVIDTFTVNYRDTLVSVGGVRNNMCKTEGYLLATTDSHNNRRLQEYQFDNTHNITNHLK